MRAWPVRFLTIVLAALGAVWGAWSLPLFWHARGLENTADLIIQGHRFSTSELATMVASTEADGSIARAAARRAVAILKVRLVEDALEQGDRLALDRRFADLKRSVVELFEVDPADPLFWLIYYWASTTTEGFQVAQLRFLQESYVLGPNEGWIAVKRNRLALAAVSQLSPELFDRVTKEFAGLVSSGLIIEAAVNLTGPGLTVRSELLQRLSNVPIAERERLARYLREIGSDLSVPGVVLPENRMH